MGSKVQNRCFEGVRLTTDGARESGSLTISAGTVDFSGMHSSVCIPIQGLAISRGGSNDRILYLKHPALHGDTLITYDRGLVAALKDLNDPGLLPQLRATERSRHRALWGIAAVVVVVIGTAIGLIWAHDPLAGYIARRIPVEWEMRAGDAIAPTMTAVSIESPDVGSALTEFVAPLVDTVRSSGFTPRFFIMPDSAFNAFALPGGIVVILTPVIERAESGTEVLGVLAHELAHVTERHVVKNIVSSVGLYAIFSFLIGDAVGAIAAIANTAPVLLSKSYSRDLERDADSVGFQYLLDAGIDPRGMVRFFERVLDEETRAAEALPIPGSLPGLQFLSTHPATHERIEELKARIAELPPRTYRDIEPAFQRLKRALRQKGER
ncbi:MAG: hypothetical protein RL417_1434 [Pseudomonadota bacterium]|jgi:predicted Zn-dependent protease